MNNETAFTNLYEQGEKVIYPVAHGEGHYYCTDEIYGQLKANNQIILNYGIIRTVDLMILQITSAKGNVCGMMPHPERALETLLGTDSGVKLFEAMVKKLEGTTCLNLWNQSMKKLNLKKYMRYRIELIE